MLKKRHRARFRLFKKAVIVSIAGIVIMVLTFNHGTYHLLETGIVLLRMAQLITALTTMPVLTAVKMRFSMF